MDLSREQQQTDWLFLTSANAVEYFFTNQHERFNYKIAVIGEKQKKNWQNLVTNQILSHLSISQKYF